MIPFLTHTQLRTSASDGAVTIITGRCGLDVTATCDGCHSRAIRQLVKRMTINRTKGST
jgi:hypothetical protein